MNYQTGVRYLELPPTAEQEEESLVLTEERVSKLALWTAEPVRFVLDVLHGTPDPWQCDVMDTIADPAVDNIALRACHGVGKTALLAWVINWFTTTRDYCKVPTTAPTYNKQVRDVLWAEVHKWYRTGLENPNNEIARWLLSYFELNVTRLQHVQHPNEWFAVGIASSEPLNIEGYHSPALLAIFDEAKGIKRQIWESVMGMRTTQEAKLVVASTPGGPLGEFYKVFTQYRTTWKNLFVIHPIQLKPNLKRKEAPLFSQRGTYYSSRVRDQFLREGGEQWGVDSPVYIARCIGDFPTMEGDVLIPYAWLSDAEDLEFAAPGPRVVSCDVARYGRDRTVILCGEGGMVNYGETIARTKAESYSPDVSDENVGDNPRQPRYRSVDATADACRRVRQEFNADFIVIDDTGVGGGVTDILKRKGEQVIGINFGSSPTDRPKDAEERAARQRKHQLDSKFVNLKAEMGWKLRNAFETSQISLANLPPQIRDLLMAQASMTRYEMDAAGRIKIIDPDEQEDLGIAAGDFEGRKSPDHFHSLLLYWWVAGKLEAAVRPLSGAPRIPSTIKRLGSSQRPSSQPGQTSPLPAGTPGGRQGQAGWIRRAYRR